MSQEWIVSDHSRSTNFYEISHILYRPADYITLMSYNTVNINGRTYLSRSKKVVNNRKINWKKEGF